MEVQVVWGGDGDGVEFVAEWLVHLAEISERLGTGVFFGGSGEAISIDIAETDDGRSGFLVARYVAGAFASNTDTGELDFGIGSENRAGDDLEAESGGSGRFEESAAVGGLAHGSFFRCGVGGSGVDTGHNRHFSPKMGTKKDELFGHFRRGGFSSKIRFLDHFYEETKIRIDNNQNLFLVLFIFIFKYLKHLNKIRK